MSIKILDLRMWGLVKARAAQARTHGAYVQVAGSTLAPPPIDVHTPGPRARSHESRMLVGADLARYSTRSHESDLLVAGGRRRFGNTRAHESRVLVAGATQLITHTLLHESDLLVAGDPGPTLSGLELYAWHFDQDGHVFYVLQVGSRGTFVYDLTTGRWSQWQTEGTRIWQAVRGISYLGRPIALHPTKAAILHVVPQGSSDFEGKSVRRVVTTYLKLTARSSLPLGCLYVDASLDATGAPLSGNDLSLYYSDDGGDTWVKMGSVSVPLSESSQYPIAFRSLGLVRYPGKLFQIIDVGGPVRISGLDALILPQHLNPEQPDG